MRSSVSGVLALDRALSGVLVRVNNRMLIHRGLRTSVSAAKIAICSYFVMGRVGIEPTTLGLRVDASVFRALATAAQPAWLSQISSYSLRRSRARLLTFC